MNVFLGLVWIYPGRVGKCGEGGRVGKFDIKGEDAGGMAQKGDDVTVARKLHELLRELEGKSQTTFPGDPACACSEDESVRTNYAEQCRFLKLLQECEEMMWGVAGGIAFRYERTWGQTARMMQDKMQAKLHTACELRCSDLWYCKDIQQVSVVLQWICFFKYI
jgi:hypothetical protein